MKVQLNSFHLNGYTQTKKLEPPCTGVKVIVSSFTAYINCVPLVFSNSPPECAVCGKAIKGKIGKQGYQCRGNN